MKLDNANTLKVVGLWEENSLAVCPECEIGVYHKHGVAYYSNVKTGEVFSPTLSDFGVCEDGRVIRSLICPECGRDMRVEGC